FRRWDVVEHPRTRSVRPAGLAVHDLTGRRPTRDQPPTRLEDHDDDLAVRHRLADIPDHRGFGPRAKRYAGEGREVAPGSYGAVEDRWRDACVPVVRPGQCPGGHRTLSGAGNDTTSRGTDADGHRRCDGHDGKGAGGLDQAVPTDATPDPSVPVRRCIR